MNRVINSDTLLGAALVLIGVGLLWSSYQQNAVAFVFPGDAPPFLVPQLFLYLWIGVSLLVFMSGLRRGGLAVPRQRWGAIALSFVVVVAAAALMRPVGYLVVAPVAVFATILCLGYRRHWINATVAVGVSGTLYILLTYVAGLPLPKVPGLGV